MVAQEHLSQALKVGGFRRLAREEDLTLTWFGDS
jgi:hypothetical protein